MKMDEQYFLCCKTHADQDLEVTRSQLLWMLVHAYANKFEFLFDVKISNKRILTHEELLAIEIEGC